MAQTSLDEKIRQIMERVPRNGHNSAIGFRMLSVERGKCECFLDWSAELVADPESGILASGPIISMMDTACGTAVWTAIDDIATNVTLDLRVDYLRPARPGRRVIGRAECYHVTRRIAFVRGMAHDGDPERAVAQVTGSFVYTREEAN